LPTVKNFKIKHFLNKPSMKKFNGLKAAMMLFFTIMIFSISANAANIQWDGGGDGVSWNDGLNWVNDVVPGTADNAIFPTSVGTLTVSGTASSAVSSLQIWNAANVSLNLDVTVASTNATVVKLFDGSSLTVKSGATLTVTVTGVSAAAVLFDKPNGAFIVEAGGTANLTAWRGITSFAGSTAATVDNYGTMNIDASNASIQPNNATAMTIVNHSCGVINSPNKFMKIWSNAAVSSITNNGFINSTGAGAAVSVSGSNIATNNAFYISATGAFAAGSGTKTDNGINLNSGNDTIDVMNSCSIAAMGILSAHNWYSDTTATTMVGSNDSLGALSFSANAFANSGTQTIYSCYGSGVALTILNVDGTCITPDSIDVTFLVGTSNLASVDPAGLFLAGGGTFGNPGDNPMTDANGDGIWEITVRLEEGFTTDYIFTNGICPSWSCKEQLGGLPCAVQPHNDRHFAGAWSDTTVLTCFGTCNTDTICPPPPVFVDLTLTVDMSQYGSSFTGVNIFGSFNGWNNTANPLTDQGNGLWQGTITVNENDSIEYKFVVDSSGTLSDETLMVGASCTKTTGPFTNRFLAYGNTNMTVPTVCWASCATCYTPNIQWDGGGDGVSWNDGLNWVGDLVPNSTEQAIFPTSTGTLTVSGTATSPVAGIQIWDSASVTLDLDVTVNATTANSVKLFNGSMLTVGAGRTFDVTLTGVNDGCIIFTQPNGEFKVENGATVNLDGWRGINSYAAATAAAVNNYGVINITGGNATIQPNNATAMTIVNHPCGTFNFLSGVTKIWSNAATSTFTNNGLVNRTFGTGSALSVSTGNIGTNNAFFSAPNNVFASGSGTKVDNGISLNGGDTLDAMNSCAIASMGILAAYNWYSDTTAMTMVGSNDTLGALSFSANAFASSGTQTIYTCYGSGVALTILNVDGACTPVVADSVDITFLVNTANITVDATGLFVGGGTGFGGPTDNPMMDANNDGVWEVTLRRPKGFSSDYIFINGNGGWSFKEQLAGQPCAVGPHNDRTMPGIWGDTTLLTCFGSCVPDTICPAPPAMIDLTFIVDMSEYTGTFNGVNMFGNFNGWQNTANPMTDQGNGVWETTITVNENDSIEYKFVADSSGTLMEEVFAGGEVCTKTSGQFTNRFLAYGNMNMTVDTVCWESCVACIPSSTNQFIVDDNLFTIQPNLARDYTNIRFAGNAINQEKSINVFNALGQLISNVIVENKDVYRMNVSELPSGIYFINVQSDNKMATKRLVIQK